MLKHRREGLVQLAALLAIACGPKTATDADSSNGGTTASEPAATETTGSGTLESGETTGSTSGSAASTTSMDDVCGPPDTESGSEGGGVVGGHGGPYANAPWLDDGAWRPDGGLVLAGRVLSDLWVGATDASGALLSKQVLPSVEGRYQSDGSVIHHPEGIFVAAHLGARSSEAEAVALVQLDHELWHVSSHVMPVPRFDLGISVRTAAVHTPEGDIVIVSRFDEELLLIRRPNGGSSVPESVIIDVNGQPADLAALTDEGVITASNDTQPRIARVNAAAEVLWAQSLSPDDSAWVDRVAFDASHELIFVGGSIRPGGGASRLWLQVLDVHGDHVWMWTAPPHPHGVGEPVLDITALPDGGAALSTFLSWIIVVHPWAC